jgi:hypothetical protein
MNKTYPEKEDPFLILFEGLMKGSSDGLIEEQEKRGQSKVIDSEVLPKKFNYCTKEQFEKMGIVFGKDADDLFCYVDFPKGWKKERMDNPLWSKLVDEKGRKRALIFYKAAFYDRDAFLNISSRYSYSYFETTDENGDYVDQNVATHFSTYITDCGNPIKCIAVRKREYGSEESDIHSNMARKWLEKNFPDYENPLAYWD